MARRCCCDGNGGGGNGGEPGCTDFLCLTDTPDEYTNHGGDIVIVNVTETGLEFITVQDICDACGEIQDTNFANTSLTFTDNRTHTLHNGANDYDLIITGQGTSFIRELITAGGQLELNPTSASLTNLGDAANPNVTVYSDRTEIVGQHVDLKPGTGQTAPDLRFYEDEANGSFYVSFEAAADLLGSTVYILPDADGDAGQVLSTDGMGVLSWVDNLTAGDAEEVVRNANDPAGAPNLGEDLYVQITDGKLYYNDGANWTQFVFNPDTHLFSEDKTGAKALAANRQHDLGGFDFWINGGTTSSVYLANDTGGWFFVDETAAQLGFDVTGDNPYINVISTDVEIWSPITTLRSYVAESVAPEFRFSEAGDSGTFYVGFKAPNNLLVNTTYTWPLNAGTNGQVLTTNGSGTLSWGTAAASDTNLFITNSQTLQGDYTHSLNAKSFTATGGTTSAATWGNTAGGDIVVNATHAQLRYHGGGDTARFTVLAGTTTNTNDVFALAPISGGTAPVLRFYENQANGTNFIGFKAPASLTVAPDVVYTLPSADGTSGQALTTNGTGTLSWGTVAAADTHFFSEDKTGAKALAANRVHDLGGFSFTATGGTTSQAIWGNSAGGDIVLNATNVLLRYHGGADVARLTIVDGTTTITNQTVDFKPGTGQTAPTLKLYENAANGTNFIGLKAPASLTVAPDVVYTLPSTDGTNGQVMTTNGSGTLSWSTATGGSTPYVFEHDATTSWGAASGGYYTISVAAATHGKSPPRDASSWQGTGFALGVSVGPWDKVEPDRTQFETDNDVTIRVTESPDGRYAGRLIIW